MADVGVSSWYDQTIQADRYALDRYVWRTLGRQELLGEGSEDDESESEYVL
jgi:hypothetical protein